MSLVVTQPKGLIALTPETDNQTSMDISQSCLQYSVLIYIHTYHSRFIPEGVAEVSQIILRDTHVLPKLVSYKEHCRRDRW
jgi:hypothetical protein